MGWADTYIAGLKRGETVSFRPRGGSMTGKINSGDLCTVAPLGDTVLKVGDIVLCQVHGNQYLHLVKKRADDERYMIGNNRGGENGWIGRAKIFGILKSVQA
jgi:hypothetical protein